FVEKIFNENKYDIIILDEINISVRDGFLKEEEILSLLDKKPYGIELILTGRGATEKMIEKADLVSEVKKIKHPYDKGIFARKGIEF
ncbi:MAG: cob(I)yrinic acid a,c-diamide adenosyltransferase, partial [candidate division WOR-3 bacterium]